MQNAETLVINNVSHQYVFPAVLLIFFGTIFLYNFYMLVSHHFRMEKLSEAEGLIVSGHKKLVANREDLFVEGYGVLDGNFMIDQISGNDDELAALGYEDAQKRRRKAAVRAKKRFEKEQKRLQRIETKKKAKEEKAMRKLTPKQRQRQLKKDAALYRTAMDTFHASSVVTINEMDKILDSTLKENEKLFNYLINKYGNKAQKKQLEEIRKEQIASEKKKQKRRVKKAVRKAEKSADADIFTPRKKKEA